MSNSPMFVVGIYSGADKLGEGFGTSLQMAEFRVCLLLRSRIETFCLASFLFFSLYYRQQQILYADST